MDQDDEPEETLLQRWLRPIRNLVPERYPLIRLAFPTQLVVLPTALFVAWLAGARMPGFWPECGIVRSVLIVLVGEALFLIVYLLLLPFVGKVKLPGYLKLLIEALKKSHAVDLVVTCAMVGFMEELVFRGIVSPLVGPLPAALLFAIAHRPRAVFHWLTLTSLGLLFSLEVRLTGGLLVPMVHHGLHDLLAMWVLQQSLKNDPDAKILIIF
ncbi:MAG: CPBP family intramembrane metalloprotease [Candidatus Riflebacteria bacterium]|nr:CPBP family intramembrane metalloprotease [Candidatus Riflebacteria bacterium]